MAYGLAVDRRELVNGLRRFIRAEVWPSQKAVISFDGRFFSIKAANRVIVAMALAPPEGEPVKISCDGKRLRFGSFTVMCAWQPVSVTLLSLPGAPDWLEALSREYRACRAQNCLDGSSDPRVVKSEQQLARLVSRAAKPLAALGITENDIRSLIEKRLAQRHNPRTGT
jgi:hypothetical protein